jgi:hypothetical protein
MRLSTAATGRAWGLEIEAFASLVVVEARRRHWIAVF